MKKLVKKNVKSLINSLGYTISKISEFKFNEYDPFKIQHKLLEDHKGQKIIFDVGAYNGNISKRYNTLFPKSNIYAFEPYINSYYQLVENLKTLNNTTTVNKALGKKSGFSKYHINGSVLTNSLLATSSMASEIWGKGLLDTSEIKEVPVTTIDDFMEEENIDRIHILKMDTQGTEYDVLLGAHKTLSRNKIDLIYSEIILMPAYDGQKELEELLTLLKSYGYKLFNFYNYALDKKGQLKQVDAIFVKDKFFEMSK